MIINLINVTKKLAEGVREIADILDIELSDSGILIYADENCSSLSVAFDGTACKIGYSKAPEFFRALGILAEKHRQGPFEVRETSAFDTLTFMTDNSRNAVHNITTVKKLIRHLAVCGYHALMLYTEDTYAVEGYPYFGYMRGRFTAEQIQECDQYAAMFGMELIPCIQTLAHLNAIFKWDAFSHVNDITDILLVDSDETYKLIDAMLGSLAKMYTSRRINVGMDESFMLGRGKYLDRNGQRRRFDIIAHHLQTVVELCSKHGFSPMIWSDMFFRDADTPLVPVNGALPREQIDRIPKEISLIHWDYITQEKDWCVEALQRHLMAERNVIFAGGAWKWQGFVPSNQYSFWVGRNAIGACCTTGIREVILTAWGDNGAEGSVFSIIPTIQLYAEGCYANDMSDAHIRQRMRTCWDADLEGFMALDLPNLLPCGNESPGNYYKNPSKYLFFQDILCGLFDKHIVPDLFNRHLDDAIEQIEKGMKANPKWCYIFDVLLKYTRALRKKMDMGLRIQRAVASNDREGLEIIAGRELPELLRLVEEVHTAARAQWVEENKIYGWEVLDLRLGGLETRIKSAALRLKEYLDGKVECLEEVMEERLYYESWTNPEENIHANAWRWTDIVTASVL